MKTRNITLLGIASGVILSTGSLFAQSTAVTDPVGYITHNVAGNASMNPVGADTIIGPVLVNPNEFVGTSSSDPSGLTTVTFSGDVPTTLDGTYLLEISSAAREGWWSAISSSDATSITVDNALPTGLGGNVDVKVRKFTTVHDFLGDNTPGFTALTDVITEGDQVIVVDPSTQIAQTIIYVETSAGVPAGWYDFVSFDEVSNQPIFPGSAVTARIFGTDSIAFTSVGHVKLGKTEVDIFVGDNFIAPSLATGTTLGGLDLVGQIREELGGGEGDLINLLSPAQAVTPYVVADGGAGVGIFDFVTFDPGESVPVAGGAGFVLRRNAAPEGTITVPAQFVAP
jgi:hypothetical protein